MRIIVRLDIKNNFVIKGINLEGLRKVGDPSELLTKYYIEGADEILLVDAVASLYGRNNLFNIIEKAVKKTFIPITLGGGIRSIDDIKKALDSGVDKIALNTYATENPEIIERAVNLFGSSTIMMNIDAKKIHTTNWEVYKNYGREKTGLEVKNWIKLIQKLGCGEILLTSIDNEGLEKGYDIPLLEYIYSEVKVPLIMSGGCGSKNDVDNIKTKFPNVSVSMASILHYNKFKIKELR
tara:strand:- start:24362 stop:25075 length:714 start_codon:yes stop_codon:yes gene_type:complete